MVVERTAAESAGNRLFSDSETTLILDAEVTRDRLLEAFESIADQARPQDVFMSSTAAPAMR